MLIHNLACHLERSERLPEPQTGDFSLHFVSLKMTMNRVRYQGIFYSISIVSELFFFRQKRAATSRQLIFQSNKIFPLKKDNTEWLESNTQIQFYIE